jgi:hypothetical protein
MRLPWLCLLRKGRCIGGPLTTAWLGKMPGPPPNGFNPFISSRLAFEGHVGCALLA